MSIKTRISVITSSLFCIASFVLVHTASAATLTLSPSTGTVNVGGTISVDIMLDTQEAAIDGVDVYSLRYDPSILEVQDSKSSASGVQITPGSLFPITLTNKVTGGLIQLSQVSSGGTNYTGTGTLGTIVFKGLKNGASTVVFDFTPGSTSDSNVAGSGTDKLTNVSNGSYAVGIGVAIEPPLAATTVTTTTTVTTIPVKPSGLSREQIDAILSLLASFGADSSIIENVRISLEGTGGAVHTSFTRNLSLYQSDPDVKALQQFLNTHGFIIASTGFGSVGNETNYFGIKTYNALVKYQQSVGLPATGYFGPMTRTKISSY